VAARGLEAVPEVAARVQPSVVQIFAGQATGSGVVWTADGLIITNEHVVRGVSAVQVAFADGRRVAGAVVAVDKVVDIALVRAERTGLPAARYQNELPVVGELAVVIGSPLGFNNSVTAGVVSGLHRSIPGSAPRDQSLVDMIQTDAPISPGNSGGAVLDADGEVVGIALAYIAPQSGAVSLGFAIPTSTALDVAEQLRSNGRAQHAFAGLEPAAITPQIAAQLGLTDIKGVIVAGVVPKGPAATAGIRPGDIITTVDRQPVLSPEGFLAALRPKDPGTSVTFNVRATDGTTRNVSVTLTDRPVVSP
jgi:S1-C subfamily serine protease